MALVVSRLAVDGGLIELFSKAAVGALVYAISILVLDAGGARRQTGALIASLRARRATVWPAT
jgi:hypothetical protein